MPPESAAQATLTPLRGVSVRRVGADEGPVLRRVMIACARCNPVEVAFTRRQRVAMRFARREKWVKQAAEVQSDSNPLWLAWGGDRPIGIVGAEAHGGGTALIHTLWLEPKHRIGPAVPALLSAVAQWAEVRGVKRVYCDVVESNKDAQRLYRHLGFRTSGRSDGSLRMELTAENADKARARLSRAMQRSENHLGG